MPDIRWLNLGKRTSQGKKRIIAGRRDRQRTVRVCASCGQLDLAAGRNNRYEHRTWLPTARHGDRGCARIALAPSCEPRCAVATRRRWVLIVSPTPAWRPRCAGPPVKVIGGSPEHLAVTAIDAVRASERRALLIHDTVPGGAGTSPSSDHTQVWAVLSKHDGWSGMSVPRRGFGSRATLSASPSHRHKRDGQRCRAPPR